MQCIISCRDGWRRDSWRRVMVVMPVVYIYCASGHPRIHCCLGWRTLTAGTPNVPPNTFQTPRPNIDPTIASFVVTINSSPEAIASLDKKDKHSSIKVCCYALMIFIPLAILLALMTLVYFVYQYKPGEGWYHKCWDATKTSDTLLICKGLLENYCFNAVAPNVLDRCARAGYYPDGTVTHVW